LGAFQTEVAAAREDTRRQLNELSDQVQHLEKVNSERLEEIDGLRAEIDQRKPLTEVAIKYINELMLVKK